MPKAWLYVFALVLPVILRVLLVELGMHEWFWYNGYENAYNVLARLRVSPLFLALIGGWALPVYVITVISYWVMDYDDETIGMQFALLPLGYVPFAIAADILKHMAFNPAVLITYPFVIIPFGYLYIAMWFVLIWILAKLRIVAEH